ncbi:MAG: diguanylate cyclase (GGDEF)-like protein/PAS domain S-box-containing protein [Paraglaciecola sp.]|jgi:diguanylate cyclase (GGDEF)-like protein/PAS domain S-box-containing protein
MFIMNFADIDAETLLHSLQIGVVVHSPTTEILYANPKALEILRLSKEQAEGKTAIDPLWKFVDKNNKEIGTDAYPVNRILANHKSLSNLEAGISDSTTDDVTWVLCNAYPEFDQAQKLKRIIVTLIDITHQKKDIPFESIVELANDIIMVTDADTITGDGPKIVYVNKAFTALTGFSREEAIGKTPRILQGPDTDVSELKRIRDKLKLQENVRAEVLNYSKNNESFWLDMNIVPLKNAYNEVTYFAAVERDVTEQKNKVAILKEIAIRDSLTGLLDRGGFLEVAKNALARAKRSQTSYCLAMLDIDFFKKINDSFGHDIGDDALIYFSNVLHSLLRESDVFGRVGGEEFAILLTGTNLKAGLQKMEMIRRSIENSPFITPSGTAAPITVSIGITEDHDASKDISSLMIKADKALYGAKNAGRNQVMAVI